MRAYLGVAVAALFLGGAQADEKPPIIPTLTALEMQTCEEEGGCLVISRAALRAFVAEKERMALQACRNLL
jgi:hypothetical protein